MGNCNLSVTCVRLLLPYLVPSERLKQGLFGFFSFNKNRLQLKGNCTKNSAKIKDFFNSSHFIC